MAESNRDIADQFESRISQLNSRRILLEGKHRWLRPDEICEVLRNPNGVAISEEPAVMPPSGSIFLFDRKVQRHFRNDGYKWKKAKDGRTKEGHEKLKVEGLDTLHCYYAHGEEDQNFRRRSYRMIEENLSHMVLVHYLDVKGEKGKARYIEETESAEGVQHSCKSDEITPNSEMDSFASSSFNPSNFQHSQAMDETNLNSAPTSESENTESAYPFPEINARYLDRSHPLIRTNCNGREVKEAVSSWFGPSNFQMLSQAIDTESLSDVYTSDFEDAQSACDDCRWEGFLNNAVTTGFSEPGLFDFGMDYFGSPWLVDMANLYSENSSYFGDDETAWTHSRASSSVVVEPSPLGKRQRDSTASEEGKSQATHNATMEEVDKEKDEEEEGNDINQVRKRPKVTCGQKSNSVAPSNDSEEATLAVGTSPPQGEVIAGNNPAASDVAVTIDRAITDGAMNDATALSQDDETTRLAAFHIAVPTLAATAAIGPIHLDPYTVANVADQSQPPVRQPTATIGVAIAATTNKIAAPESSNPALVQSRPTSNANQDQPQMPTIGIAVSAATNKTAAPESSNPALVQSRPTSNANQDQPQMPTIEVAVSAATNKTAAPESSNPALVPSRPTSNANQDQPQMPTIGVAVSAATNKTAAPESSNPALVQSRPTSNANQDQPQMPTIGVAVFAATDKSAAPESSNPALVQTRPTSNANHDFVQDVESQEKETKPTSFEPENGKGKIMVQGDVGTEKFQIQDSPSIIQSQEDDATTRLAAFSITDPSGTASLARGPIHLNPDTIANVVDQAQDSQPTVTMGIVISAPTNETAASESSNHALEQWEPTSNADQYFTQDVVESQEKETEPTSVEPETGKSKAVVQRDFGTGKSHEFAKVVMSSLKRLHKLLDQGSAPNTVASSSISTPTIDLQTIATARAILEMDFIAMAGEVQRTHMILGIQSLVDSNCLPTGTGPQIMAMLKQLEKSVPAYSKAYSEYDMGKNLTGQVEASKQLLQPRVQFCDSKEKEFQELEEKKMKIEARQGAILEEIHGTVKETEPIQAQLEKLLLQQDQFKENEGNLKAILDIGDGFWTTFKNTIHRHLPT